MLPPFRSLKKKSGFYRDHPVVAVFDNTVLNSLEFFE